MQSTELYIMKCITILLLLVGFSLALPLSRKQLEDDTFQLAVQVLAECIDRPHNFVQCIRNSQIPDLQSRLVDLVDLLIPDSGQVIRLCKDYGDYFAQCLMDNLDLSLNDIFKQEKSTLRTAIAQALVTPRSATISVDLCKLLGCSFK